MSKNKILDVLAAAALRATGGSVPEAIRLLSEPFAMPRAGTRPASNVNADAIIDHYKDLLDELEGDGFTMEGKLGVVTLWKKALIEGTTGYESLDERVVPDELEGKPELAMLYKALHIQDGASEALPLLEKAKTYIDSDSADEPSTKKSRLSKPSTKKPRVSRKEQGYRLIPIADFMAAKRPNVAHRVLILYILMKYGKKPYGRDMPITKNDIYKVLLGLEGLPGTGGGLYADNSKPGSLNFITWVSNFLADNLLKQYFGIQGRPIVDEQDSELLQYQEAIDAEMLALGKNANDNWLEATELSDEDVAFYDEHFSSEQARYDVRTEIEKTGIKGEDGKIYDYFNWATYPLGEDNPLSLAPTRSAPAWFDFYVPERNNVPFREVQPKRSKRSVVPSSSSSSSSGTGPKVANRRTVPSVRRVASPGQQQKPTILQLEGEIEKSRVRLAEVSRNADPDLDYVRMLTDRMGKFKADIARLQQEEEERRREESARRVVLGYEILGDLESEPEPDRYSPYSFEIGGPGQEALEAQNAGDYTGSQNILFGNFPVTPGTTAMEDLASLIPYWEGEGEGEVTGSLEPESESQGGEAPYTGQINPAVDSPFPW